MNGLIQRGSYRAATAASIKNISTKVSSTSFSCDLNDFCENSSLMVGVKCFACRLHYLD